MEEKQKVAQKCPSSSARSMKAGTSPLRGWNKCTECRREKPRW